MLNRIQQLGHTVIQFCSDVGRSAVFLFSIFTRGPIHCHFGSSFVRQIYYVGVYSFFIIVVSGLFIGMVVGLQGYNTLQAFGAEQELGELIALSVIRELAPVVGALLFAGRAGSALAAEIGLMRATEQLSCMEIMAVDPIVKIVAPRFWAGFISLPILTIFFMVVAIYGGHLVSVDWLKVDNGAFWANMQSSVHFTSDILNGVIKSVCFALVVTWVAVYQGYHAIPNSKGVSDATTRTVVYGSLLVLGLDFVLTALMMGGWG